MLRLSTKSTRANAALLTTLSSSRRVLTSQLHTGNNQSRTSVTSQQPITATSTTTSTTSTIPKELRYLNSLPAKTLFSYFCIGLTTSSKPVLNAVIALFPYIPFPILNFFIGDIYIGGSTPAEVIKKTETLEKRGISNVLLSLTIENSDGTKVGIDSDYIVKETVDSLHTILKVQMMNKLQQASDVNNVAPSYIVLKPSALIEDPANVLIHHDKPQYAAAFAQLSQNCEKVCQEVAKLNDQFKQLFPLREEAAFVTCIDAENYQMQQGVYKLQRDLSSKFNTLTRPVEVMGTVQMYLCDSIPQIQKDDAIAKQQGFKLGYKLVRGAYIHSEPDRSVIFATKEQTDLNYDTGVNQILSKLATKETNIDHLLIASHNKPSTLNLLSQITPANKNKLIVGQLLGMSDTLAYEVTQDLKFNKLVKYVPWGPPLETKDYLLRRLQENGDAVRGDNGLRLVGDVLKVCWGKITGKANH